MKHKLILFIAGILMLSRAFGQCPPGSSVTLSSVITNVSCNQGSNGAIEAVVQQGTAPYVYSWSNGGASNKITDLSAGAYSVTVTDALGCMASLTGMVVSQPGPFIYNVTIKNETCFGACDGALDFFLSGGTPPYTYLWKNATTGDTLGAQEDISGLCSGIYQLSIIDANGCTGGIFYLIAAPGAINVNANITNVSCPGGSDGRIITITSGGTGTKTYLWSTGETSKNLLNKPAGNYSITVTDVNGCTGTRTFTITEPSPLSASANITNVACKGFNNAAIDITPSGGTAPYTFIWSNGATTEDLSNLAPGTYCVTITDSKTCVSDSICFSVTEPDELNISAAITNAVCRGDNSGAIDINVSGGTPPYTYAWTGGITTEDLSALSAGIYMVKITDANGCEKTATYAVRTENSIILSIGITEPLCGESNGSATVSIAGGDAPYTISWSNGGTGNTISSIPAGAYSVTVTDANGCTATAQADVSNVTDMSITGNVTNAICGNASSGAIDITVTGGTAPYLFQWSSGSATEDLNNLAPGSYTVIVTDSNGCKAVKTFEVIEESGMTITETRTAPDCAQSNGSISISVSGGVAPYSYAWTDGQSVATATGLDAGIYVVTVTDANGCEETKIIALEDTGGPQISVNKTDITCDNPTGTVEVVVNAGTPPFTYQWSNGATTAVVTDVEAGIYGVLVTDSTGCSTMGFAIVLPGNGIVIQAAQTEPSCPGSSDGAIDITVAAGVAPFTYAWSNGATTEDISGIPAGTYSITVTDSTGCSATTDISVDEPDEIIASLDSTIQPLCPGGNDGSVFISSTGGTAPYTYSWSNGNTTEDLSGIAAGQYCVTVTDAHGCTSNPYCFTLNEPEEITITPNITNVKCAGGNDGAIDITVSGGTAPYTYYWTGGITTEDLSNLAPGLYTVQVLDAHGCLKEATFAVRTQNILIISLGVTQPLCGEANGSVTVSPVGGTTPYTYSWSNGASDATLDNLPAGSYTVTVTDANGCTATKTADLSNVNDITITGNVTNTICGTANAGAIDISVAGGIPPLNYSWSNGSTDEDLSGLAAGSYTLTVTDSSGCKEVATFVVTEESGLTISATTTPANCAQPDGSIDVTVTGGTAPYTYAWSNGQTGASISGLSAGVYVVTVSDSNGCEETKTVLLANNSGPQISINKTDITCDNPTGTLEVVITGTPPFTIQWSNGATTPVITGLEPGIYAVSVTDSAGCSAVAFEILLPGTGITIQAAPTEPTCFGSSDGSVDVTVTQGKAPFTYQWSNGAGSEDLSGIPAGNYSVTVTDANGCTAATQVDLDEPDEIIATQDTMSQPLCNGDSTGSVGISVTGGTAPYSYSWSTGDTTEDLTNIATGQYCVTVTDAHGCVSNPFCFSVDEPDSLQIQPNITQPRCNGEDNGSVSVTVSGGVPPYNYSWSTGDTTDNISGLTAGSYSLTVTDVNGCEKSESFTVEQPDSLLASIQDSSNVNCNSANDGSVTVSVSGGTAPYSFNWSNGDTTQNLTGLPPGTYQLTVTDANGCVDSTDAVTITQPDSLLVTGNIQQPNCTIPGRIDVLVNGGTLPYSYSWSTGDTTNYLDNLSGGGVYDVTVTDANGCTASASFTVIEPPIMDVLIVQTDSILCNGASTATLCADVSGVPGPYFYNWSTGDTTSCISGLPAGTYSVTVANGSGCSAYENGFIVTQPAQITPSISTVSPECNGDVTGSATVTVSGGTPPYTYSWSNGGSGNTIDSLPAGSISVTVTDANGCTASANGNITQPAPLDLSGTMLQQVTCDTTQDGSINVVITGGTPPYTFVWSDSTAGPVRDNLSEGAYSVTVFDGHECSAAATYTIDGPPCNLPPVAVDDTAKLFVCAGEGIDIPVLLNDSDPDGDSIYVSGILGAPFHGTVRVNADGTITYVPGSGFIGIDTFSYIICESNVQPSLCDSGLVVVAVLPCRPNISIPNGFSPNGDGINDGFVIPGIEFFPDNELLLFNRWGNKVREFHGYKNEWTGTNNDGEPLPDGTYYYILRLNDDANTTYTGFVIIHR